ncbi:MAG: hypothetical protein ACK559_38975, partial [bacterium]
MTCRFLLCRVACLASLAPCRLHFLAQTHQSLLSLLDHSGEQCRESHSIELVTVVERAPVYDQFHPHIDVLPDFI